MNKKDITIVGFMIWITFWYLAYKIFNFAWDKYEYTSDECCEIIYVEPQLSILTFVSILFFVLGVMIPWMLKNYYNKVNEDIKSLEEIEKWRKEIEENCEYKVQQNLSIPPLLPICKLTDDVCDYNSCPMRKR